jgi:hypothetical protein
LGLDGVTKVHVPETLIVHSGAPAPEPDTGSAIRPAPGAFAVGIATRNQGDSIGPLMRSIERGLRSVFPEGNAVVIHADGGSLDGTVERAREAVGDPEAHLIQVRFESDPQTLPQSAGLVDPAALRMILQEAERLGVPGCAVVDAQVRTLSPAWVERLTRPLVEEGLDFVAPYYLRHPFEGLITSAIAYPLVRALFGKQVRFPLPTDFACSAKFRGALLSGSEPWPAELGRVGAEAWLLTRAVTGDFRLGQTFLGVKDNAGTESASGNELADVLVRVLGGLFLEAEWFASAWQKTRRSIPVTLLGRPQSGLPEARAIEPSRAMEFFRLGERNLQEVWRVVLSPAELLELGKVARLPIEAFRFPDTLWVRIVYDFALAHRLRVMSRDHLLSAFVPLYQGWLAGFALELPDADPAAAEQRIEALCLKFESEKPYLISRWRWPDRFSP